jgi:ankyrin repeat protein
MRNIYEILGELNELRQKNADDSEHFDALGKYISAKYYRSAANFIQIKLKEGPAKSPYVMKLAELLEHYQPENEKDSQKRLARLLNAINKSPINNTSIKHELETGCLVVINNRYTGKDKPPLKNGMTPLQAAIQTGNKDVIDLLFNQGSDPEQIKDINATLNKDGETALHIAVRLNNHVLIGNILQRNPDVNIKDKNGYTPLHIACRNNVDDIAFWLLNKGADPAIRYRFGDRNSSSAAIAMQNGKSKLLEFMINKGYKPTPNEISTAKKDNPIMYGIFREPYRARKRQIIANSKMQKESDLENLDALFAVMHIEDKDLAAKIKAEIINIYKSDTLLRPLLDIAILAANRKHDSGLKEQGKALKIIFTIGTDISDVTQSGEKTHGMYKGKNTIYVAANPNKPKFTLSSALHELKHFADQQVYKNVDYPFKKEQESEFNALIEILKNYLKKYENTQTTTSKKNPDKILYQNISDIFKEYNHHDRLAEILVKIPETIGRIGIVKGLKCLEKNIPELLGYYEKYFNADAKEYLSQRMTQSHELIPPPSISPRK